MWSWFGRECEQLELGHWWVALGWCRRSAQRPEREPGSGVRLACIACTASIVLLQGLARRQHEWRSKARELEETRQLLEEEEEVDHGRVDSTTNKFPRRRCSWVEFFHKFAPSKGCFSHGEFTGLSPSLARQCSSVGMHLLSRSRISSDVKQQLSLLALSAAIRHLKSQ